MPIQAELREAADALVAAIKAKEDWPTAFDCERSYYPDVDFDEHSSEAALQRIRTFVLPRSASGEPIDRISERLELIVDLTACSYVERTPGKGDSVQDLLAEIAAHYRKPDNRKIVHNGQAYRLLRTEQLAVYDPARLRETGVLVCGCRFTLELTKDF
jgi:hypothetical protein